MAAKTAEALERLSILPKREKKGKKEDKMIEEKRARECNQTCEAREAS